MNNNRKFLLTLVVPLLIVAYLLYKPIMTQLYGSELSLKTRPVDPIDLFTGTYQTLEFMDEIVEVPKSDLATGTPLYVIYQDGKLAKTSLTEPEHGVYIKAKLGIYLLDKEKPRLAEVQFPIDRFYIEEGSGAKLEKAFATGKSVQTHVKVYKGHISLIDVIAK